MRARNVSTRIAIVLFTLAAAAGAQDRPRAPGAASPGEPTRETVVPSRCPTFSWSIVPDAATIHGVAQPLLEDGSPDEGASVLEWRTGGAVSAWSPSAEDCLEPGRRYAWAVRSEGETGASEWSLPLYFRVPESPSADELARALEVVRRHLESSERSASEDSAATFRRVFGTDQEPAVAREAVDRGRVAEPPREERVGAEITLPSSLHVDRSGAASSYAIHAERDGAGSAIYGVNTGNGNAGTFAGRVYASGEPAILGSLLEAEVAVSTDPGTLPTAVTGLNAPSGTSGYLGQFGGGVVGHSSGAVAGVKGTNNGGGPAGRFEGDLEVTGAIDCSGCVGPGDVENKTIGPEQLVLGAVTVGRIAADAVGSTEIAANAVGSSEIATGAVGTSELADGSVASVDIQNGTIDHEDVAGGVFYKSKSDVYERATTTSVAAGSSTASIIAACDDPGDLPLTGYCFYNHPLVTVTNEQPFAWSLPAASAQWQCIFYNSSGAAVSVTAAILCVDKP